MKTGAKTVSVSKLNRVIWYDDDNWRGQFVELIPKLRDLVYEAQPGWRQPEVEPTK